jgi:hypothetical protein
LNSPQFIEVKPLPVDGAPSKEATVILATSQIISVQAGKNNTSEILLEGSKVALHVADSYDDMKRKLGITF